MFSCLFLVSTVIWIVRAQSNAPGYVISTKGANGACKKASDYDADFAAIRAFPNVKPGPLYVRLTASPGCHVLALVNQTATKHDMSVLVDSALPVTKDGKVDFRLLFFLLDQLHFTTRYEIEDCRWLKGIAITVKGTEIDAMDVGELVQAIQNYRFGSNGRSGRRGTFPCDFFIGLVAPASFWSSPAKRDVRLATLHWLVEDEPISRGIVPKEAAMALVRDVQELAKLLEMKEEGQIWVASTGWPSQSNSKASASLAAQQDYWKAIACAGGVSGAAVTLWNSAFDDPLVTDVYGLAGKDCQPRFDLTQC